MHITKFYFCPMSSYMLFLYQVAMDLITLIQKEDQRATSVALNSLQTQKSLRNPVGPKGLQLRKLPCRFQQNQHASLSTLAILLRQKIVLVLECLFFARQSAAFLPSYNECPSIRISVTEFCWTEILKIACQPGLKAEHAQRI